MADCRSFLRDDFRFPARPENRAALDRIRYRVARYPDFLELLNREINDAVALRAWTHREADDPGIALLEGAAIVGDILTFYQEHYANEAFLRTARWRESIADLTRLLGYRLSPGLGGHATFAFEVKGERPVVVPAAFPLKASLEKVETAAELQTDQALTAHPHLSRFHLYRRRRFDAYLSSGDSTIEIADVGGDASSAAVDDLALQPGDKLMLLPAEPGWTSSGTSFSDTQKTPQVLKVKAVTPQLGRTLVELETPLTARWNQPVSAWRIGRSFRHFGHTAPETYVENTEDSSGKIDGAEEHDTEYLRHVDTDHDCTKSDASIELPGTLIPLDSQVDDLFVGGGIIVQTQVRSSSGSSPVPLTVLRTIEALRASSIAFTSVTGQTTLLTMDRELITHDNLSHPTCDVRDYQIFEVTSPAIALAPKADFRSNAFANGTNALYFHGTTTEAKALAGRRLALLRESDGELVTLTCTNVPDDFVSAAEDAKMWPLSFDQAPAPFTRADFDEEEPTVTVFGNLVDASQGKAQKEVVLGNGDARRGFQTFKLPKAPLTYLLAAGATPPHAPELTLYVAGRAWNRVESFFGRSPDEEIYIVREDPDGDSYVQFGDGATGARLPSGVKNVSAVYRTGAGAHGPMKSGRTPSAGERIDGLDKVQLPGEVSGGSEPEAGDRAREAAPGKIQSLGRLVSIRDYETEVLTIPGVTAASAAWGLDEGVPSVLLRVLMEAGRESEFEAVRATISRYQQCRGPDRHPVTVAQALLRYAYLTLSYAFDPALRQDDVEAAIEAALGLVGDEDHARTGLFGLRGRRLGGKEYATRVEGVVQAVAGVLWCKVTGLGLLASGALDPAALAAPTAPQPVDDVVSPAESELLQLHPLHLTLASAPVPAPEECA